MWFNLFASCCSTLIIIDDNLFLFCVFPSSFSSSFCSYSNYKSFAFFLGQNVILLRVWQIFDPKSVFVLFQETRILSVKHVCTIIPQVGISNRHTKSHTIICYLSLNDNWTLVHTIQHIYVTSNHRRTGALWPFYLNDRIHASKLNFIKYWSDFIL